MQLWPRRETTCAGRGDHGHLTADQVGHQRRQPIVLALQPVVLDRHVLALDVTGFAEAFAERGHIARVAFGRAVAEKPDHRQRRLLRARRERPSAAAPPRSVMNSRRLIAAPEGRDRASYRVKRVD